MADAYSLSVIAPCLNEEVNLPVLAERLFAATDEAGISTELVLVDDGSTDGSWGAIQRLRESRGDSVVGVRHTENFGIAESWRSGLDAARGTYACFIDASVWRVVREALRDFVPAFAEFRVGTQPRHDLRIGRKTLPYPPGRHPYSGWRRAL